VKSPVKFGKYYLLERINVGGMAEIFKAKSFGEAGFERLVAVKRILPSVAEDHEFIAMFVDEAKLAVQLTHPNIAQIFELGKVNDTYFIALEYVPGRDLRTVFERAKKKNEPIPIPLACYSIMKLCEGLDYAHNKKDAAGRNLDLVHRDVSPQNILLSWEGDVKLIDFGIAKAASKSSRTQAGILKGKFGYMSPEQVRGQGVDRRSDVFAAGIVLYELLTGERLFGGGDDFSTLERVRNCDFAPPSKKNPTIPEELEQIMLKSLTKNVEERHRTAMDLHDELQSFMYTSGHFFARKDLGSFMHRAFQDDITKEAAKDEEYRKFDSRRASDLDVFDGAQAPTAMTTNGRNVPPPPPGAPKVSVPPPPPSRGKATMMGGLQAPMGAPAVSPPPPLSPQKTLMGSGPAASAPKVNGNHAPAPPASGASAGLDMDWDDEELATQVYDKIDIPSHPMKPLTAAPPPPAPASIPPPGRGPVAPPPGFTQGAQGGASYAPPRAQTQPLPSAGINAPKALPAIPAPPPMASPMSVPAPGPAVGAPMVPSLSGPAVGAPNFNGPPPGANPYSMGPAPSIAPPIVQGQPVAARPPASATATAPHAAQSSKKNNSMPLVFAGVGLFALAAGAGLIIMFTRPKVGTIEVSSNVPDVQLEVDGRTTGMGQRFTVGNLESNRPHTIVARRQGYRTRELQVQVASGEVTPVPVVLEPEAPQMAMNTGTQGMPVQGGVVQPMGVQPMGVQPMGVQPMGVQPMGVQPMGVQPMGVQQMGVQPMGTQPMAVQPMGVQPMGVQPMGVQPMGVQPMGVQPMGVQPMGVQPMGGQPVQTQPVAVNQPTQQPSSGGSNRNVRRQPRGGSSSSSSSGSVTPRLVSSSGNSGGGGSGFLSISTRPASRCTVAGQTFSTPRLRLSLPAGTHRVQCNNSDFGVGATFSVSVRDGQETREINHPLN
jgi:serine/threonine protein kinase